MICDKVQDIVFVCSLNMDVAGAAIATDIAQALSCFAAIIYMVKKYPLFRWKLKELTFEWSLVSALVKMLMCGKVTHKNLIDSSPYYSENQVKMNRFLKVCMIKYDYEKIDKS